MLPKHPPHKKRQGLSRLWCAIAHSWAGLYAAWSEAAFRQELYVALVMIPTAFWLGRSSVEIALLVGSVVGVLIVELLNSGLEAAVDRVGTEWHELSKRAKDLGSAAVLLSLLLCAGVWIGILVF